MAVTEQLDSLLRTLMTVAGDIAVPSGGDTAADDAAGVSGGPTADAGGGAGADDSSSEAQSTGPGGGDAIDRELARPKRMTAVVSLRDSAEVEAFRNELIDGLIRVDTANKLLQLVNQVMTRLLM